MIYEEEMKIIGLYRSNLFAELTLQEIMKKLSKKSYYWTHKAVKKLQKASIINVRKAGKTLLCSFNFRSHRAIAHLAYAENLAGSNAIPELLAAKLVDSLAKCTPFFILMIGGSYAAGTARKGSDIDIAIIVENEDAKKAIKPYLKAAIEISEIEVDEYIFTRQEFKEMLIRQEENLGKEMARKHVTIYGADSYYSIIMWAHRNGFQG
ncbi:MAG: nucleotidyltransferase domain-containing protein [Nanoarchaeota archaeon]|nr:nucleotidyltransferase domain-containing protein [Nanoarchaeota archaeon]